MCSLGLAIVLSSGAAQAQPRDPVVFFSGGTLDDEVVHMLLLAMPNVDLRGVVVSNSDSFADFAVSGHWKVAQALKRTDIPLALSLAKGWNAFPYSYREDSIKFVGLECLKPYPDHADWPPYPLGEAVLEKLLEAAIKNGRQMTLLVTAPVTPVAKLLRHKPELEKGIKRMIFMGGAINVPGNLDPETIPKAIANPRAEWNVFWDPRSTQWLFANTSFEIVMFPLDVTNHAKITKEFKTRLRILSQSSLAAKIASEAYGLIWNQPFYCLWNTTAASYLANPSLFESPVPLRLGVVVDGYEQGSVIRTENGRKVNAVFKFSNKGRFYDEVLELLSNE